MPLTVAPAAPSGTGDVRSAWSPDGVIRWAMRVPWLWPALLTLAIGSYQLDRPLLWRDELWSWSFAADPTRVLIRSISGWNVAQLPYEMLLHFWVAVAGDSVVALRLPSLIAMSAAAAVVALIARRLAGSGAGALAGSGAGSAGSRVRELAGRLGGSRAGALAGSRAGLLAGLVFALVPSVARFAQEARFYAPQLLAVAVATLLLLRALDVPSARRWAAYAACLAVVGYLDLVALSVVAGHAGGVALRCWSERRPRLAAWFGGAALTGMLACLPLILGSASKAGSQVGWIPRPGLGIAAFTGFTWQLFYSVPVAVAVIVFTLLAIPAWREAGFAVSVAVLPVAAVWILSQGSVSYFFPRYLLFTVAAWAVLAGIGLSRLNGPAAALCLLAVALAGAHDQQQIRLPGAHNWAGYPVVPGNRFYWDFAGAAGWIASRAQPGDGIVYPDHAYWQMTGPGVSYYLSRDLPPGTAPPRELLITTTAQSPVAVPSPAAAISTPAAAEPPAAVVNPPWCRHPAACLGSSQRIWVVANGDPRDIAQALAPNRAAVLRRHYRLAYTRRFRGITVFLLDRTT